MAKIAIPGAIVVAGLLIAGAVFYSSNAPSAPQNQQEADVTVALPVTEDDHILGSPNAKITIIEYSDIDCPFCKNFHETMKQIIDEYGPSGDVAWVYRHFPLTSIHPNAARHALAAECAAEVGGNESFWSIIDVMLENAPGNQQTDPSRYSEFAAEIGLDTQAFEACIADGSLMTKIEESFNTAIAAGATGTPFNIVLVEGQDPASFSSALPYEQMKGVIDQILSSS
ncbi:MAG: DsbA family protein [Patescibacteria group bacterium UBA2103]